MLFNLSAKRLIGLFIAALTVLTALVAIDVAPSAASGDKKVIIHYQRTDNKYTGWNVWLWGGAEGKAYDFKKEGNTYLTDDYGAWGEWTVEGSASASQIGFIIRLNDWVSKDPDGDRFITEFVDIDGVPTAEIWVKTNSKFIWTKKPSTTPALLGVQIKSTNTMKLVFDNNFVLDDQKANFNFTDSKGDPVAISSWGALTGNAFNGYSTTVTLASSIRIGTTYKVSHPVYGTQESDLGSLWREAEFNDKYFYNDQQGDGVGDLGNTFSANSTEFRVWAPTADSVDLVTYENADSALESGTVYEMTSSVKGTWVHTLPGNQDGTIYMYRAHFGDKVNEAIDPYVRAATINGNRGVVVDLSTTNPTGWHTTAKPNFNSGNPTDAIIYELHVRDFSVHSSSGIRNDYKGKYLAFTQKGTKYTYKGKSTATGLDAIKDLGATHIELLPIYDFGSVDETGAGNQFNWGYDPKNYNVPEGSYSTNAADPKARIIELKTAIMAIHQAGLRVNMDSVYNHVQDSTNFSFEKLVPGYWYRRDATGTKTSGSGCGNDTASENPMVSKYIQDSVKYWATEYKIDGFRFDLMGLIDITTMNAIRTQLNQIDPTIIMLGEGWNMGTLPIEQRATQDNSAKIPGIATFNQIMRDGMKGNVWNEDNTGWVTGRYGDFLSVYSGIVANAPYPGLAGAWIGGIQPDQTINYIESHDNTTFADRIRTSMGKKLPMTTVAKVSKLGTGLLLVSQGIPFIHAGQEYLRSKNFNHNSYNASDDINSLKYGNRLTYASNVSYLKGLIQIRKAHKAFRMTTAQNILDRVEFLDGTFGQIGYKINGKAVGDSWSSIVVLANSNPTKTATFDVPKGVYKVVVEGDVAGTKTLRTITVTGKYTGKVTIKGLSMMVLWK